MWTGLVSAAKVELDFVFHVCESGRHCMVFMHMKWERLALPGRLLPTIFIAVFIFIMALEGDYTEVVRLNFFSIGKTSFR